MNLFQVHCHKTHNELSCRRPYHVVILYIFDTYIVSCIYIAKRNFMRFCALKDNQPITIIRDATECFRRAVDCHTHIKLPMYITTHRLSYLI